MIHAKLGGVAKWLRQRSAKPLFTSSNLVAASREITKGYSLFKTVTLFSFLAFDVLKTAGFKEARKGLLDNLILYVGRTSKAHQNQAL